MGCHLHGSDDQASIHMEARREIGEIAESCLAQWYSVDEANVHHIVFFEVEW